MSLLLTLTLIYIAVLVLALAVSLITILVYLRRIASSLAEVQSALGTVQEKTEPLETPLQLLQDAGQSLKADLVRVSENLTQGDHDINIFSIQ
jgi:uncharacterized protein YoxC